MTTRWLTAVAPPGKAGYNCTYAQVVNNGVGTGYQIVANPNRFSSTGVKACCSFEDAVVRTDGGATAGTLTDAACVGTLAALQ